MSLTQSVVDTVCANNGAFLTGTVAYVAGAVGLASVLANFRNKLPASVVSVLDTLALNFVKSAAAKVITTLPPSTEKKD